MAWKVGLLSCRLAGALVEMEGTAAQVIRELVEEELDGEIVDDRTVPGELHEIMAALIEMTEYYRPHLILTSGGISLSPQDVVPEATLQVADRAVPGLPEAMRAAAMQHSPEAMLNRAAAAIRGGTLIVNLPGDPKGVHECLAAILSQLPVALRQISAKEEGKHVGRKHDDAGN